MKLFLDFETRSTVDLKEAGAWNYACHPSTKILCAAYAFENSPVELWKPGDPEDIPTFLSDHVKEGGRIIGHNFAGFDTYIWEKVWSLDPIPAEQLIDTMSLAYAMALPGSLEGAAAALGLSHQKDMKAHRVMLQLSQPRTTEPLTWWEPENSPEKFEMLYAYAKKDIEATRELFTKLVGLDHREEKIWQLDYKINRKGVPIDLPAVTKAMQIVEREQQRLNKEIQTITDGAVCTAQATAQLSGWLQLQLDLPKKPSVDKQSVLDALASNIPPKVRRALEIRQEAAKSSTAKLSAMASVACPNDFRIRGAFAYHGAATGRWAGRKVQLHNLKRGSAPDGIFDAILDDSLEILYVNPLKTLSESLRGFIKAPPGKVFIGADYSAIEARVLAWLAGEEKVLKVFRGHGKIYEAAAANIYGVPIDQVTEAQRFVGKVAVLALGYGGGKKAFQKMAAAYGVDIDEDRAEMIKIKWRDAHLRIVKYWSDLEHAAIRAVQNPGRSFRAGPKLNSIAYLKHGNFLWCYLPSGRPICYPFAKVVMKDTPWGIPKVTLEYMAVDSLTRKWGPSHLYGGLLAENITQGVARDVMADAMVRLDDAGFSVVLHVHDSITVEVDETKAEEIKKEVLEKILELSIWAQGLPLDAKPWIGARFTG